MPKSKKSSEKKSKSKVINKLIKKDIKHLLTKANIFGFIVIVFIVMSFWQTGRALQQSYVLEKRDSSLIKEIGQMSQAYNSIGADMNEVRSYLGMQTKTYKNIDDLKSGDGSGSTNEVSSALYKYVEFLSDKEKINKNITNYKLYLNELAKSATFRTFLAGNKLYLSAINENTNNIRAEIKTADNKYYILVFYVDKEKGEFFWKSALSKDKMTFKNHQEFGTKVTAFIKNNQVKIIQQIEKISKLKKSLDTFIKSNQKTFSGLKMIISNKAEDRDLKYTYYIKNTTGAVIGKIILNQKNVTISVFDGNSAKTRQNIKIETELMPFIKSLNAKTFIETRVSDARKKIDTYIKGVQIKALLKQSGLKISEKPREDSKRIYYDLKDAKEKHISSIVIEKTTGVINIVQPNGTNSENLLFFDSRLKKKL